MIRNLILLSLGTALVAAGLLAAPPASERVAAGGRPALVAFFPFDDLLFPAAAAYGAYRIYEDVTGEDDDE